MKPTKTVKKGRSQRRAVGIGGIFFRSSNPASLSKWYRDHLGLSIENNVALFGWHGGSDRKLKGHTVWSVFPKESDYFPISNQFMVNYRVKNLVKLLRDLRREGVRVAKKTEESVLGKFGWVYDPDGNKIELWEPPPRSRFSEKENLMR